MWPVAASEMSREPAQGDTHRVLERCYTGGGRYGCAGSRQVTTQTKRWTIADLEQFPQPWDDTRYEIIDAEVAGRIMAR